MIGMGKSTTRKELKRFLPLRYVSADTVRQVIMKTRSVTWKQFDAMAPRDRAALNGAVKNEFYR